MIHGPSLAEQLAAAPDINLLASYREQMAAAFRSGELQPSSKTQRVWLETLWQRVIELIGMATTPQEVTLISNVVSAWPKPAAFAGMLGEMVRARCAVLPNEAEQLRARGITIVGITG